MAPSIPDISHLLDYMAVIIIVIDSDQNVSYINKKGCEILGYEREDILGKNWFDNFLPEKLRADIKTVFHKLMTGEIELAEYIDNVVLTKTGQERIIGWRNTILKNDMGTIIGTLSWGEDLTDRRRLDNNKDDLIQDLQSKVSELKSMKMKLPICSWNAEDVKEAIKKHYDCISREGKCFNCLNVLKMTPQIKKKG